MISLWKIIRNLLAILGALYLLGAVGASDYHVIELGQAEPSFVGRNLVIGIVLMLPLLASVLYEMYKEGRDDHVD